MQLLCCVCTVFFFVMDGFGLVFVCLSGLRLKTFKQLFYDILHNLNERRMYIQQPVHNVITKESIAISLF